MANYTVNKAGVTRAKELIAAGTYELHGEWGDAHPDTDAENAYIERHGWDDFGAWHLAISDESDNPETKAHYGFPFGDFRKVHRNALRAAEFRAGEWEHREIERAARRLLDALDRVAKD